MGPARTLCAAACATAILLASQSAGQTTSVQARITDYEQKLADAQAAKRKADEGLDLVILGYLHRQAGEMQKALDCLGQALAIELSTNNKAGQALASGNMGRVFSNIGEEDKALDLFHQVLGIWQSLEIKPGEALALNSIAQSYNNMGDREQALNYLNQALAIWVDLGDRSTKRMLSARERIHDLGQLRQLKELNDVLPADVKEQLGRDGEANTHDALGQTYSAMGRGQQALEEFNRALPLWREAGQKSGEALTLNNMGRAYADLGQKQNALDSFNQALAMWRSLGNRQGEAMTLENVGRLYRDLGLQQSALDYYNQALPIFRDTDTKAGEGLALNDIGRAYADMGQDQKAVEVSEQALPFWRACENLRGEAMTLNNLGRDYFDLGQAAKSLEYDTQALVLWRQVKDRRGESLALMTVGWAQFGLKQWGQALENELIALALAKQAGDPEIEGGIETALMIGFRAEQHPEEAIYFGLEAVTAYQTIRKNISELDKDLQAGFAQSKSMTYRILAELLIEAGRLGEAEQILDMLKEQELKDIVRGGSSGTAVKLAPISLSPAEKRIQSTIEALENPALECEQLNVEAAGLKQKTARTPQDEARLKELNTGIELNKNAILAGFSGTVLTNMMQQAAASRANSSDAAPSYLQTSLSKLGPQVVGIRLLLGEDHAYEIVVTANARKSFTLNATSAELRAKVLETLKVLASRSVDPKPQLTQLYSLIVAPIEGELKPMEKAGNSPNDVPTLLWSLDDVLRYLPMAALYDGSRYMLERFNNVLFTPESYGHMTDAPLSNAIPPVVLAMGLSRSYGGLPPLPGVLPELDSIVHDPSAPESHGLMTGKLLIDNDCTLSALRTQLGSGGGFPIVHIASHFVAEPGSAGGPYLMLGGENTGSDKGFAWPLSDLQNSSIAFHGTRLLTLSACSTGKDYTSRNGVEMDSLGMVAQQKDAEAVLATLWDVNDASTSRLMSDFYTRWLKDPAGGKGEALRQAQLALLNGQTEEVNTASQRGFEAESTDQATPKQARYSHPYYWAPFVLIGNFR